MLSKEIKAQHNCRIQTNIIVVVCTVGAVDFRKKYNNPAMKRQNITMYYIHVGTLKKKKINLFISACPSEFYFETGSCLLAPATSPRPSIKLHLTAVTFFHTLLFCHVVLHTTAKQRGRGEQTVNNDAG